MIPDSFQLMLRLRYFLPLLLLTACAPATGVAPTAVPATDIDQIRQLQSNLQNRLTELENRLARVENQLDKQRQQLDQPRNSTEMGTGDGQITESKPQPTPRQTTDDTGNGQTPTALYLRAFSAYAAGRYAEATDDFRQFLDLYPRNPFAGNAQFWLGECYYRKHLLKRAVDEFAKVVSIDPSGKKAPDALLRMVAVYRELDRPIMAEQTLQQLLTDYPDSAAARKAGTR
ncbi:tol-pal system protein YbgF [Geothermobacter hydrogeniphilus]|uniref:tol-pal system protein YbgF n=1 Tax=Geothermobacter hydrogeniphilus TaxID=1969733 RepID=UPI001FE4FFE2|nr:tol-pal system protein YbgF [Geothermobacter hydrogeniphilus]